ncbi:divalent-cation tolerance protein CutA [Nocardiopsis gilva YIM 90087]|uniref:Divalent-cation tolerance protein CutA n=1 Tax=Nocardiopsis gilva YIM 90087 TaxID=1235441 RepID=A0A223S0E6_9ACTN|nr:divalent-cation tolerance protein CutA [Nocardiopsis gilva]ASU81567.1 divalent-cation tolerance protein CutA [Nocardiopsis gilva YIM 90087]
MAESMTHAVPVRVEMTTDDRASAVELARSVVERGLVACAQVGGPITSHYRWQGEVCADEEWMVVMKTSRDRLDDLTAHLVEAHSYDVPEIIAVPVEGGNPEYLDWVVAETRRAEPTMPSTPATHE